MRAARARVPARHRHPPLVPRLRPRRGAGAPGGAAALSTDPRSRRIALVADSLLDALLDELRERGYGVIQLPPAELDPATRAAWHEQVAEHVAEFRRTGYEVALADDGTNEAPLAALGAAGLAQYAIQPPSTSRLMPET
jgi:hypothetical protein